MKVTVYLTKGKLDFEDFDAATALDLTESLRTEKFLTFEMDDGTVLVNRDYIVRVDFDS